MTYARKHDRDKLFKSNHLCISARWDLCSHPCLLFTDISTYYFTWHVINFYNNMADPSALTTLLSSDIDPLIPTMLAGDFNAFSLIWYNMFNRPIPSSLQCKSGTQIEALALAQDLSLLSPPGVPTCKGENSQRDSILDLVWVNQQAWEDGYFSYLTY